MSAIYIVNTYDSKGRPFFDEGSHFTAEEYGGDEAALKAANECFDWHLTHGQRVKLLKVS